MHVIREQQVEIPQYDLNAFRQILHDLNERVARLEKAVGIEPASLPAQTSQSIEKPAGISLPKAELKPAAVQPPTPALPRPAAVSSVDNQINLESRIGSHWLNRIGIAAVLIGVSYFLKFAFDNNWIGPTGRISIGLLAGIAIIVWSERFRSRGYAIFSYSLKAVGSGILYLSLWAAFHVYSLIPSGVAFAAMLIVTVSIAAMALSQNAEILAAFALTGGFATPALLATGQNKELALFAYVTMLDFGMLAMLVIHPWQRLLLLSYAGTLLLYIGWYFEFYSRAQLSLTLAFATVFFAVFAIAPFIARQPEEEASRFLSLPLFLAFVNACVYFLQAYAMVSEVNETAMAWFALVLAAVYIALSRQAGARYRDEVLSQKLRLLHLALAAGFITVAIPIRLNAHWITMGWFVEAAILIWVADRIRSELLNAFAVLALVMGVVRLLFIDDFNSTSLLVNARMATHLVAIAVLAILAWYASKRKDDRGRIASAIAIVGINALALVALSREVNDSFERQISAVRLPAGHWDILDWNKYHALQVARDFTYSALWMGYGALLMVVGFWRRSAFVRWQALVLLAFTTVKVFAYDVWQLNTIYRILSFVALGVLLLAVSFGYQRDWLRLAQRKNLESAGPVQS
jgi:uncharacterized membrane protein